VLALVGEVVGSLLMLVGVIALLFVPFVIRQDSPEEGVRLLGIGSVLLVVGLWIRRRSRGKRLHE
jgi:hypothetical protein